MSNYKCDFCRELCEYIGEYVFIKFKCPSYFATAGRVLMIIDDLVFIEYIYDGITITCCDNISYFTPIQIT